ncbi:MAG: hypothetical protein VB957_13600 [Pseudomonadales bacterium]
MPGFNQQVGLHSTHIVVGWYVNPYGFIQPAVNFDLDIAEFRNDNRLRGGIDTATYRLLN